MSQVQGYVGRQQEKTADTRERKTQNHQKGRSKDSDTNEEGQRQQEMEDDDIMTMEGMIRKNIKTYINATGTPAAAGQICWCKVEVDHVTANAIIDTGAIGGPLLRRMGAAGKEPRPERKATTSLTGLSDKVTIDAAYETSVTLSLGCRDVQINVLVAPGMQFDLLLGYGLIKTVGLKLDDTGGRHYATFPKWNVRVPVEPGQPPVTVYALPTETRTSKKGGTRPQATVGWTPEGLRGITDGKALQSEIDFIFGTHGISTLQKIRENRVTKRIVIRLKFDAIEKPWNLPPRYRKYFRTAGYSRKEKWITKTNQKRRSDGWS